MKLLKNTLLLLMMMFLSSTVFGQIKFSTTNLETNQVETKNYPNFYMLILMTIDDYDNIFAGIYILDLETDDEISKVILYIYDYDKKNEKLHDFMCKDINGDDCIMTVRFVDEDKDIKVSLRTDDLIIHAEGNIIIK